MAGETVITIVGNLTRDPELRTIASGSTVVNFTIPSSTRTYNRNTSQWEDGDTLFMNCSAWDGRGSLASNIASSLAKGMRVIAQGRLTQRSYQAQDGTQRTVVELRVDEIGPSLTRATAQVNRQSASGNAGNGGFGGNRGGFNANNGGFGGNNGGYQGGAGYSGGVGYQGNGGYQGGASAPANANPAPAAPAQTAPASDPWGSSDNSGSSFGSFGASQSFGGSSEFGGDSDEPEF